MDHERESVRREEGGKRKGGKKRLNLMLLHAGWENEITADMCAHITTTLRIP